MWSHCDNFSQLSINSALLWVCHFITLITVLCMLLIVSASISLNTSLICALVSVSLIAIIFVNISIIAFYITSDCWSYSVTVAADAADRLFSMYVKYWSSFWKFLMKIFSMSSVSLSILHSSLMSVYISDSELNTAQPLSAFRVSLIIDLIKIVSYTF